MLLLIKPIAKINNRHIGVHIFTLSVLSVKIKGGFLNYPSYVNDYKVQLYRLFNCGNLKKYDSSVFLKSPDAFSLRDELIRMQQFSALVIPT